MTTPFTVIMSGHQEESALAPQCVGDVAREHSGFQADLDSAYERLTELFDEPLTLSRGIEVLVPLIGTCIQLVEKVAASSGDHGNAKKELALALISKVIAESAESESQKIMLQHLLESMGPQIIDLALDAKNGKLIASKFQQLKQKICAMQCCCCRAK